MGLEEGERGESFRVGKEGDERGESLRMGEEGKEEEEEPDGVDGILWVQFFCLRVSCCCWCCWRGGIEPFSLVGEQSTASN